MSAILNARTLSLSRLGPFPLMINGVAPPVSVCPA